MSHHRDADWFAYVAFADCGCIAAVRVDEPTHQDEVRGFVVDQLRRGHSLERIQGDAFRALPLRCRSHPNGRWVNIRDLPNDIAPEDWVDAGVRS